MAKKPDYGIMLFGNVKLLEKNPRTKKDLPRKDEAKALLIRVAKQVEPIMKQRGWKVGSLIEIIPPDNSLLGYNKNRGQLIAIRLRRVGNDDSFFPFEHVLGTMLHELTHNVVSPHNQKFYALLDELQNEADKLMDKGVTGVGAFECEGARSGGLLRSSIEGRDAMIKAAEKRRRVQEMMGGGKLGGGAVPKGMDVRELAAAAAERRARDDRWCGDRGGEGCEDGAGRQAGTGEVGEGGRGRPRVKGKTEVGEGGGRTGAGVGGGRREKGGTGTGEKRGLSGGEVAEKESEKEGGKEGMLASWRETGGEGG